MKITCPRCGSEYIKGAHWFDFTPPQTMRDGSARWLAWQHLQENGLVSYTADPERNLSVGEREDCRRFGRFCRCTGLVLDVGCGPQPWPAYFTATDKVTYVGIDPLAALGPADYLKVVGLAEYLPFADRSFSHVLFSTTLDHFVDPREALREASRVLETGGEIDVWLGERDENAAKPMNSPEWYARLQRPQLAYDVFHLERFTAQTFRNMAADAGLLVVDEECHDVDPFRRHWLFRARPA
jgi:SAM-dependent methyltransferase